MKEWDDRENEMGKVPTLRLLLDFSWLFKRDRKHKILGNILIFGGIMYFGMTLLLITDWLLGYIMLNN